MRTRLLFSECFGLAKPDRNYHASELETLSAIEQHGDLNPVQKTRLTELRGANNPGNPTGVESQGLDFAQPSSQASGSFLGSSNGQPTLDLVGLTNNLLNSPEVQAANKSVVDSQAKLTARQQALATAQAGINDNPFYSEGTRMGKSQQLTQQANNDMTVIQNEIQQAQGQVSSLKADAQIKINAAQGQYNINEEAYKTNLNNFNNLVSQGALDNASSNDIAQLALQTGIPTSMIQSIQAISKAKNSVQEKPQIVQATDNQGNLSIVAVDPISGKVLQTTTIAGAGKADKPTSVSEKTTQKAQTAQYNTWAQSDAKSGKTLSSMMSYYYPSLTKQEIWDIYMTTDYYHAKPDQVKADKAKYGVK